MSADIYLEMKPELFFDGQYFTAIAFPGQMLINPGFPCNNIELRIKGRVCVEYYDYTIETFNLINYIRLTNPLFGNENIYVLRLDSDIQKLRVQGSSWLSFDSITTESVPRSEAEIWWSSLNESKKNEIFLIHNKKEVQKTNAIRKLKWSS